MGVYVRVYRYLCVKCHNAALVERMETDASPPSTRRFLDDTEGSPTKRRSLVKPDDDAVRRLWLTSSDEPTQTLGRCLVSS